MNKLILMLSFLTGISTTSIGQTAQPKAPKRQRQVINTDDLRIIDLAQPITTATFQITNGKPLKIKFINLVPKGRYTVNGVTTVNVLPPLTPPGSTNTDSSRVDGAVATPATPSRCDELKNLLENATSESDVSKLLAEGAGTAGCNINDEYSAITTYDYNNGEMHNETLTIVVTNTAITPNKSWSFTFKTKPEGEFFTTYGFTFIPLIFGKPHTYYAQQQPSVTPAAGQPAPPTKYNITESANADHFNYAPTVLFHYINYKDDSWSGSWTAGLGINLNASNNSNSISPLVMAGYSLLFHQNIGVSFGFAGHTVSNLKGNYSTDTPITTNLESADLNRQVIVVNPFVSITFRFSSNPNKGSGGSTPNTLGTTP